MLLSVKEHAPSQSVWGVHRLQKARATQEQKVNSYFPDKRGAVSTLYTIFTRLQSPFWGKPMWLHGHQTSCGTVSMLPYILCWSTSSKKGKDFTRRLKWSDRAVRISPCTSLNVICYPPPCFVSISEALKELGHNAPLELGKLLPSDRWVVSWSSTHTPHICSG